MKIISIGHLCQWHKWCTLTCEYLRKFSKKFETALMVYSGAWGKLIHEKNRSRKSRDSVPLKVCTWEWYHWISLEKVINCYRFFIFFSPLNIWQDFKVLSCFMQKWIQPPACSDHGLHRILPSYWLTHFYWMKNPPKCCSSLLHRIVSPDNTLKLRPQGPPTTTIHLLTVKSPPIWSGSSSTPTIDCGSCRPSAFCWANNRLSFFTG